MKELVALQELSYEQTLWSKKKTFSFPSLWNVKNFPLLKLFGRWSQNIDVSNTSLGGKMAKISQKTLDLAISC